MRDEFKTDARDYQTRHQAERSYLCQISRAMKSREAYTVKGLNAITKIPKHKISWALHVLTVFNIVEKVEPEPINYPEWYEDAGQYARRAWKVRNNIPIHKGRTPARWRRKV